MSTKDNVHHDNVSGFGEMVGAAMHGFIAGENAANYAKEVPTPSINGVRGTIDEKKEILQKISGREVGASWREVNIALQQLMSDYAENNGLRSGTMLTAGLTHIRRLREKAYGTMMARNGHELMRCLEVLNMLDLAELVFIAASARKETRGIFTRSDYPYADPALDGKKIVLKKEDNKVVTRFEKR